MKYNIVEYDGTEWRANTLVGKAALAAWAKERDMRITGHEAGLHLRAELRGHPNIEGLCGPMWGDKGTVRYENWDAYDVLSR